MNRNLIKAIDLLISPITFISSIWLKLIRRYVVKFWSNNSIFSKRIFNFVGVFPILDHYYEPKFNYSNIKIPFNKPRILPGIDLNIDGQLEILNSFNFSEELVELANKPKEKLVYSFDVGPFNSGDAEYLYNMIRHFKPRRILEIGSGHSTLIANHAVKKNMEIYDFQEIKHICIEPFEHKWLEELGIEVIRSMVEDIPLDFFKQLESNDILFIDSSHVIRPQGDVLFEYLQILPSLNKGVIIHIHDIFTPRDYLQEWFDNGTLFWNEQYLLEAFLTLNSSFRIIGAVNYLKHEYYDSLIEKCPMLSKNREPGSFWIQKVM